jgi:hypothetical protein
MPPVTPRELPAVCAWCRRVRDPLDQRWLPADPQPAAPGTAPNPVDLPGVPQRGHPRGAAGARRRERCLTAPARVRYNSCSFLARWGPAACDRSPRPGRGATA